MTTYYRSGESGGKPSPFAKRPKKRGYKKFFLTSADTVAVIILFLIIGYSLLVSSNPEVKITASSYHNQQDYKKTVAESLGSLKNRNKFTFDEQSIAKSLRNKYPEISNVDVELPIFSPVPTFRLSIAEPSFILNSSGRLYIVSSSGRAITSANGFPNLSSLVVVNDETGFRTVLGQQVMSHEGILFLNNLLAQSKKAGVPVSTITLPAKAEELHLRTSDKNYYTKFYLGGDANVEIGQFLAARHSFDSKGTQPSEYLDVRVPGKIYYK